MYSSSTSVADTFVTEKLSKVTMPLMGMTCTVPGFGILVPHTASGTMLPEVSSLEVHASIVLRGCAWVVGALAWARTTNVSPHRVFRLWYSSLATIVKLATFPVVPCDKPGPVAVLATLQVSSAAIRLAAVLRFIALVVEETGRWSRWRGSEAEVDSRVPGSCIFYLSLLAV